MTIRRAAPDDIADITAMIHEMAEAHHAADHCTATEKQIDTALFGTVPTVYGHVAEVDGEIAAMALWFPNFSTWEGAAGMHLEDLFVRPGFRRRGLAHALLVTLARECVANGYTRLSWVVLDENVDAMALYDGIGGEKQREWVSYRVSGSRLADLAGPS